MTELEFWAMVAVVFTIIFANLGGLSGGGILVPVVIGLMRFEPRQAIV